MSYKLYIISDDMSHTSAVFILWQTTQTCHSWCIFINLGLLLMYNNNKSRIGIAMKYILCKKELFSLQSCIVGQYFFSTTNYDDDEFPVALTWSCLRSCCPALILHSFVGNTFSGSSPTTRLDKGTRGSVAELLINTHFFEDCRLLNQEHALFNNDYLFYDVF